MFENKLATDDMDDDGNDVRDELLVKFLSRVAERSRNEVDSIEIDADCQPYSHIACKYSDLW